MRGVQMQTQKRQSLKEGVIRDSAKSIKQQREYQKQRFAQIYNKLKVYEFPAVEKINMEKHFYFPKIIGRFQNMSKAALAVYPVICSQANFDKNTWIQLSQKHIAQMAGVTVNTVTKGIADLVKNDYSLITDKKTCTPLLQKRKITEGKRHFYVYQVGFIRKNMIRRWRGSFFIFHTCIIESGTWAALKPRAKLLYLTMRTKAYFDPNLYSDIEDINLDETTEASDFYNTAEYRNRKWDVCTLSLAELCRIANIDSSDILKTVQQLQYYELIERIEPVFKVYLKPKIRKGALRNWKTSKVRYG